MTNKMKKGFTLIEIVIVLAIAALIMVVVFLAVQGAQRGQRDQFRKDTANRVLAAVQSYKGNNSGAAPTAPADIRSYIGASASNTVTGGGITLTVSVAAAAPGACPAAGDLTIIYDNGITVANKDSVRACLEVGSAYTAQN